MKSALPLLLAVFVLPGPLAAQSVDISDLGFPSGAADAPIQVLEFSDFSCPFCAQFHEGTYQTLHAGYIATDKVQWVYVTFVSGQYPNSLAASAVAECAGDQGHFEKVRDRLYARQDAWKHEDPDAAGDLFLEYVEDLDMDRGAFMECVVSDRIADRINRGGALAAEVGVRGTPTYVIDGFPAMGALPAEFIGQILNARLEQLGLGR